MTRSDKKATREGKQWAGAQHRAGASPASPAPQLRVNGLRERLLREEAESGAFFFYLVPRN